MRKQLPQNFSSGSALSNSTRSIWNASGRFYLILFLAGALILSSLPLAVEAEALRTADDKVAATTENDGDLSTTKFDTLEGTVTVNLPGDTTAGDEISGTVVEEPKGKTPEEKAANQDSLEGYVVEVANKPTKENDTGQWSIPAKANSIDVVLKKKNGEVVSKTKVTVRGWDPIKKDPAAPPSDYQVPPVGQAGKPVRISGQFNGNFGTTAVKIGGNDAPPIAESPRSSIVKIPPGSAMGPTKIDVIKDGKPVASCPFTVLGIKLAAGNLHLKRGETSQMTVTVLGVRKLAGPAPVQIDNKFPTTMRLEGGDSQTLTVPANLDTETFSATRTLTGIQVGAFAITAVVRPPPCAAGGCSACSAEAKATGPKPQVDTTPPSTDTTIIKSKSNITNNRTAAAPTKWPDKVCGPIEGLVVQIARKSGSVVFTDLTDADGNVDFGVLPEGEYVLTLIALGASDPGQSKQGKTRDWVKASFDGKAERIEMKPDSSGRYSGMQFSASGMTTFRADGKSSRKYNVLDCFPRQ